MFSIGVMHTASFIRRSTFRIRTLRIEPRREEKEYRREEMCLFTACRMGMDSWGRGIG